MTSAFFLRLFMFLVLVTPASSVTPGPTVPLRFSRFLDPSNVMYLRWDFDIKTEIITFELQVRTAGWVGLGVTNRYSNVGADLVVGGILPDGNMYFSDQHVLDDDTLEEDGSQDAKLLSLTQDVVYTTMRFSRPFRSCDLHDQDITDDTIRILAAYGLNDIVQLERDKTFVKSIFLLQMIHPDDLKAPEISYIYDLEITDFLIPEDDTTYICTFLPLPIVNKKHHIYKFEGKLTPHNETMVHHILVYACGNASSLPTGMSDCYGGDPAFSLCSQVVIGWAVGGNIYQLPDEVGYSLGTPLDPQWIRLEVHYSNFNGLTGVYDSSGIRLYYTPELRRYDVGVLQLGFFTFPIHFIPPGAQNFSSFGLCKTGQFEEMNGQPVPDLQVQGYMLHTHLSGRRLKAVQYRNGSQLRIICKDDAYDFNLQEVRDVREETVIKMGDELLVECDYQTLDRTTLTFGGPSTMNEMCLIFLFYYPRNNISSCMGMPNIVDVVRELGQEASDTMEAMVMLNDIEWNNESIQKAEEACRDSEQLVIIKSVDEVVRNETGRIPIITPTPRGSCLESSGGKVESEDKLSFRTISSTPSASSSLSPSYQSSSSILLVMMILCGILSAFPGEI
ncbi:putative DBH-like monooxygenase protein 2 [Gracilinanus agilis]|uniref:putative DBH-like monooxygenase protein 2 n=1 Tax=Gracilinanus agilis TaxID=191870 RepID=UPI001CFC8274|nr:putative DBH-like monooxygenase protein 2 [Gracilinanus agilis]